MPWDVLVLVFVAPLRLRIAVVFHFAIPNNRFKIQFIIFSLDSVWMRTRSCSWTVRVRRFAIGIMLPYMRPEPVRMTDKEPSDSRFQMRICSFFTLVSFLFVWMLFGRLFLLWKSIRAHCLFVSCSPRAFGPLFAELLFYYYYCCFCFFFLLLLLLLFRSCPPFCRIVFVCGFHRNSVFAIVSRCRRLSTTGSPFDWHLWTANVFIFCSVCVCVCSVYGEVTCPKRIMIIKRANASHHKEN